MKSKIFIVSFRRGLRVLVSFGALTLATACSSGGPTPPGGDGILEQVDKEAVASPETLEPGSAPAPFPSPPESPEVAALLAKLSELGYEPVGLQFEDPGTVKLLIKVFSNAAVAKRKIKLVYTGHAMAYDPSPESLTIGGKDVNAILAFIRKKVPLQKTTK